MFQTGFDIAVIGGGVIGLATARALAKEGARVVIIDAAEAPEGAIAPASFAAAGMLAPSFEYEDMPAALGDALYRYCARGLALWRDFAPALEEETGVFVDYRADGMLGIAYSEEDRARLAEQATCVRALGGAAQMISGDEARAMEPALSAAVIAALYAPDDAQVDPRRALSALKAWLKERGAPIIAARAQSAEAQGGGYTVRLESGEKITAGKVVIATGAVSCFAPRTLVFPVKGDMTSVAMKEGLLTRVVRAPDAYLCPKAHGRLVIGATTHIGVSDHKPDPAGVAGLRANAQKAVPALEGAQELERWAGLRPGTPDGAPILGKDARGRFLALGHYRNGVLQAPAAAEAVAALVLGRTPPVDVDVFSIRRFAPDQHG